MSQKPDAPNIESLASDLYAELAQIAQNDQKPVVILRSTLTLYAPAFYTDELEGGCIPKTILDIPSILDLPSCLKELENCVANLDAIIQNMNNVIQTSPKNNLELAPLVLKTYSHTKTLIQAELTHLKLVDALKIIQKQYLQNDEPTPEEK